MSQTNPHNVDRRGGVLVDAAFHRKDSKAAAARAVMSQGAAARLAGHRDPRACDYCGTVGGGPLAELLTPWQFLAVLSGVPVTGPVWQVCQTCSGAGGRYARDIGQPGGPVDGGRLGELA